jgi:hypothetical protein
MAGLLRLERLYTSILEAPGRTQSERFVDDE